MVKRLAYNVWAVNFSFFNKSKFARSSFSHDGLSQCLNWLVDVDAVNVGLPREGRTLTVEALFVLPFALVFVFDDKA